MKRFPGWECQDQKWLPQCSHNKLSHNLLILESKEFGIFTCLTSYTSHSYQTWVNPFDYLLNTCNANSRATISHLVDPKNHYQVIRINLIFFYFTQHWTSCSSSGYFDKFPMQSGYLTPFVIILNSVEKVQFKDKSLCT